MSNLKLEVNNLDQLVKVCIFDKRESFYIKYRPYKKRWLLPDLKEGYFDKSYYGECTLVSEDKLKTGWLGSQYLIEDKKVFYKPYVELHFSNESREVKYFDTYDEAHRWFINEITGKVKNILIEYKDEK